MQMLKGVPKEGSWEQHYRKWIALFRLLCLPWSFYNKWSTVCLGSQ